jgi:hypothetical protein
MYLEQLDELENSCENKLRAALDRLRPDTTPIKEIHRILLQRYWISEEFTHIYDLALNRISPKAADAQEVIRRIIREEYPVDERGWRTPSHREDLVTDLLHIGVTRPQFASLRPTAQTEAAIKHARAIVLNLGKSSSADILLLTFLRYWGEVLTAVEYSSFWPRILRELSGSESVFYLYHKAHDEKVTPMVQVLHRIDLTTHADKLGEFIARELTTGDTDPAESFRLISQATQKAIENKLLFYKQFT